MVKDFSLQVDFEIDPGHTEGKWNNSNRKGSMSVMLIIISPAHNTESGTWKTDKMYLLREEEGTYTHTHTHSLIHSHMGTRHKIILSTEFVPETPSWLPQYFQQS